MNSLALDYVFKIACSDLDYLDKLIALNIAYHARKGEDGRGLAWASVSRMARESHMGESTAKRSLKKLRALGIIIRVEQGGIGPHIHSKTSKYFVNVPTGWTFGSRYEDFFTPPSLQDGSTVWTPKNGSTVCTPRATVCTPHSHGVDPDGLRYGPGGGHGVDLNCNKKYSINEALNTCQGQRRPPASSLGAEEEAVDAGVGAGFFEQTPELLD